jgi:beta-N-acetylhexosaminidase
MLRPSGATDLAGFTADAVLEAAVEAALARMSPADRVGQLFVITFAGDDVALDSDIVTLIHGYRVGGIILSPRNDNFSNGRGVDTARAVATLTNQLQSVAYGLLVQADQALDPMPVAPWPPRDYPFLPTISAMAPSNVPLLIGLEQIGDDLPGTALRRGFTPLPSPQAIGAAWSPELASQVGAIVGRELDAVGVNLVLSPKLDVFDQTASERVGSLGLYSFGGNAYWVSQLGRAYIGGVHEGSTGRVATVASHFPGQGSADRLPDEEVATIQKSQDELRQGALVPFVSVTRRPSSVVAADGSPQSTDIILTSHMRYSGLQGGAAGTMVPLSLAPELRTILSQEGFEEWRNSGGVIMSGSLGAPAIRRFYDDETIADQPSFFNRRVALDAFNAGNDLLLLADFGAPNSWEEQRVAIQETIGFFQDRYNSDPEFADRVDAAVRRILRLKFGLYRNDVFAAGLPGQSAGTAAQSPLPVVPLSKVMVADSDLQVLTGQARSDAELLVGQVARNAATILYPDPASQTEPIPPPFQADDRILVFTDSRLQRECASCTAEAAVGPDEIANIIKRLYGAEATGQIDPDLVTSLTFADLTQFLDGLAASSGASAAGASPLAPAPAATGPITAPLQVTAGPILSPAIPTDIASPTFPLLDDAYPAPIFGVEVQDKNAKTKQFVDEADWILFAMLDVEPNAHPNSMAAQRFLNEYSGQLGDQKLVVFALNAPYFLDATEMGHLTTYFGIYGKTQPFLEGAVRALFRSFTPAGAPPVDVPGTRFANLAERLQPNGARAIPLIVADNSGAAIAQNSSDDTSSGARPALAAGETIQVTAGPILDLNGHLVPDGTLVSFQLNFEGEELALDVARAASRSGLASQEIVLERSGRLLVAASAGEATSGTPIALTVLPPATVEAVVVAGPTDVMAAVPMRDSGTVSVEKPPDRVNLLTLVIALFTILVTLSLFMIVQVHVLPRIMLVKQILWAAIFGLAGYVLYGFGLLPGGGWLNDSVGWLGTPVTVFVPMLLPLLWLQLRGERGTD